MLYNSNGINIILYPRSYNKRGDENCHSVMGVTDDGTEVCVRLKISEQYKGADWAPSIVEFSRTDYKAKKFCVASETNCKEKREGVLLFTSANPVYDSANKANGIKTFTATWAHVLSEDSDSPSPIFGISRIEFNRESGDIKKIKEEIKMASGNPDRESELKDLIEMVSDPANFSYHSIIYHCEELVCIPSEKGNLVSKITEIIDKKSPDGIVNGFLIRKVDRNGFVIKGSCREFYPFYQRHTGRNQNGYEFLLKNGYMLDECNYIDGISRIEIIPTSRIAGGKVTSKHYSSKDNFDLLLSTYGDSENKLACRSAVKINYTNGNSLILNKLFSLSPSSGNVELLGKSGQFDKRYVGDKTRLADITPGEDDLAGRPINQIHRSNLPAIRAEWLLIGLSDNPGVDADDNKSMTTQTQDRIESNQPDLKEVENNMVIATNDSERNIDSGDIAALVENQVVTDISAPEQSEEVTEILVDNEDVFGILDDPSDNSVLPSPVVSEREVDEVDESPDMALDEIRYEYNKTASISQDTGSNNHDQIDEDSIDTLYTSQDQLNITDDEGTDNKENIALIDSEISNENIAIESPENADAPGNEQESKDEDEDEDSGMAAFLNWL